MTIGEKGHRFASMTLTYRLIVLFYLVSMGLLQAQLVQRPLQRSVGTSAKVFQRSEASTPISLPFWDDFSSSAGVPDTTLWVGSENVTVSGGIGVRPRSVNVAVFDGVDVNGKAYSNQPLDFGSTDVLTSCPIDLQAVADVTFPSAADTKTYRESLVLSWYWQMQGFGDRPDPEDSLRLEFLTATGEWVRAWSINGATTVSREDWNYQDIQVSDSLLHGAFQFRFIAYSRRTGNFDAWLIDYLYLDVGRSMNARYVDDRALVQEPGSIFGEFSAIPRHMFSAIDHVGNAQVRVDNLSNIRLYPVRLQAELSHLESGQILETIQDFSQVIDTAAQLNVPLPAPDGNLIAGVLDAVDTAVTLLLKASLVSGDTLVSTRNPVTGAVSYSVEKDFRVNDTLSREFVLHNYLAYDDGTAEFVAGMATGGGAVAYQYVFPRADTITHIDVNFPAIKGNLGGTGIELVVWADLENTPESELTSLQVTLQPAAEANAFTRYPLPKQVVIQDTVYIGWRQRTNAFIGVGLDKSGNSGSRVFSSVRGVWTQNTLVEGNLLLRAVVDTVPRPTVTHVPDIQAQSLRKVYPNPVRDECYIQGPVQAVTLQDAIGRVQAVNWYRQSADISTLLLRGLPKGVYFIRLELPSGEYQTVKILKVE